MQQPHGNQEDEVSCKQFYILGKHEYQYRKCNKALFNLSGIPEYLAALFLQYPHEMLAKPWEVVCTDIFMVNNEMKKVESMSAEDLIQATKFVFTEIVLCNPNFVEENNQYLGLSSIYLLYPLTSLPKVVKQEMPASIKQSQPFVLVTRCWSSFVFQDQ